MTIQNATAIVEGVIRAFVSAPDAVEVMTEASVAGTLFTVRVAPADLPLVLGPSQRTLRSLRSIVVALGRCSGQRYALDCCAAGGVTS